MVSSAERLNQGSISISTAVEADLPAIEDILNATVQTPYGSGEIDTDEVEKEMDRINQAMESADKGRVLIAKDKYEQPLGFAFWGKPDPRLIEFTQSDPETTTELRLLYLDPDNRGKGIGSKLLQSVEKEAKEEGNKRIVLASGPRYILIGSGEFYEKKGYTLKGTLHRFFEDKWWARVFEKDLD